MHTCKASVIISTYNQPKWLEKVLWSYELQTEPNFEIVVADDGSTSETKDLIDQFKKNSKLKIKHVWHEDKGFQKTIILNKAIVETASDYLIFTDGDCISRADFVATHLTMRKNGHALSGGYFKLSESVSNSVTKDAIELQNCFNSEWIEKKGQKKTFKNNKLTAQGSKAWFLNTFTPTKATFDGMNVSCWKADILKVNGFDERMKYGGEDREIGERLMNSGIQFIQARYSLICVHLHHERPYMNESDMIFNKNIRSQVKKEKLVWSDYGIVKK